MYHIFIYIILIFSQTEANVIDSFSDCIITVLNFAPELYHYSTKTPVLLANGSVVTSSIYSRKYLYCVTHICLFPEQFKSSLPDYQLYWLPISLINNGVRKRGIFSNQPFLLGVEYSPQYDLERHYLVILSHLKSTAFHHSVSNYRAGYFSTVYLFTIAETNSFNISYICKHCLDFDMIDIQIFHDITKLPSREDLDCVENLILARGKRVFTRISSGIAEIYTSEWEILAANTPIDIKDLEISQNTINATFERVIQTLLFHSLDLNSSISYIEGLYYDYNIFTPAFNLRTVLKFIQPESQRKDEQQLIYVDRVTFNFITCDGVKIQERVGFDPGVFLKPFDKTVWICTMVFVIFIVSLLIIMQLSGHETLGIQTTLNCFQAALEILLENGCKLDTILQEHSNQTVAIVLASWLCYTLYFNSIYKSVLTSDETVSPPASSVYKNILQLINFTVCTPVPEQIEEEHIAESHLGAAIMGLIYADENYEKYDYIFNFLESERNRAWDPRNYTNFFNFIKNCEKTAFIEVDSQIDFYLRVFNQLKGSGSGTKPIFVKGEANQKFLSLDKAWIFYFYDPKANYVYSKLESVMESGIYNWIGKWKNYQFLEKGSFYEQSYRPVALNAPIRGLLLVVAIIYLNGLVVFNVEIVFSLYTQEI